MSCLLGFFSSCNFCDVTSDVTYTLTYKFVTKSEDIIINMITYYEDVLYVYFSRIYKFHDLTFCPFSLSLFKEKKSHRT